MKSYTTSSLDIYRSCRTSETLPTPSPPRRSWRGSPTTQTIRWDQEVTFATLATCYRSRSAGKKVFHTCKPKHSVSKLSWIIILGSNQHLQFCMHTNKQYIPTLSERDTVLIERSNLVNISKLVVKEVRTTSV